MENNYLISVIVPVHNTVNYLRKCIESIRNQSLENIEIILVDNLSTDGSSEVCDEYASMDTRVKVIHLSVANASVARNAGIDVASAPYIGFIDSDDYIDEIREVMASKRHRDFPILDKDGRYLGMISRRNLLGAKGKQVILVDHNEKNQAVAGIENAEILEIIDHHRLGTIQTMSPVFFRNQPLGCTATIIYQMYQEAGIKVEPKIAGLLCSAIVSDTLLFRSPTCTPVDEMAARALADIAGIDIEKYAMEMFSAGSNLKDKSDEEIFYQDFKRFTSGKVTIGVGQITSLNGGELDKLKGRMEAFMEKALENNGLDMIFFMLTNILTETTELICEGQGALQLAGKAFHQDIELLEEEGLKEPVLRLPGVVSRKKQLIPELMLAEQE